ncbi:MAG: hypothetical protein GC153_11425 [Alphaproteobacteria bacterium]|nr:hypothetical protein [Alphaproteobacteria bacterium]
MNKEDWKEYDRLYADYVKAEAEYQAAQTLLGGVFSELARTYDPATLDHNRIYEEELAHERFNKAREKLRLFLNEKLKKS